MKIGAFQIVLAILLAVAAGCIGAFAANEWRDTNQPQTLHDFVHEQLDLTASQSARLNRLETRFAVERKELDLSLGAANARLAAAMEEEHEYGPKVAAAIDDVHARMGDLQKATVQHVFAMRALLNPQQQARFDRHVALSLTGEPGE
ncbi:MAG: Spy/CpxP family protein refolding chaperone [Tsuneonella suprasediminis]|uniref:Periplasmic heavy metal sensor n=1 Tax=Tsuneonella suprasediminis TaxID=2306996 RepID=A0A419R281_9SPHN|nr:periplasmic heavy metal sensor [Tsuneonella suprasediminis]RJX67855.1 periplasmic heavy metal sensor [Tsuneonella suprasediminis]UBS33191.1 periplasmic heavy metal sensor [Altererythrobacter sp. N1]